MLDKNTNQKTWLNMSASLMIYFSVTNSVSELPDLSWENISVKSRFDDIFNHLTKRSNSVLQKPHFVLDKNHSG